MKIFEKAVNILIICWKNGTVSSIIKTIVIVLLRDHESICDDYYNNNKKSGNTRW